MASEDDHSLGTEFTIPAFGCKDKPGSRMAQSALASVMTKWPIEKFLVSHWEYLYGCMQIDFADRNMEMQRRANLRLKNWNCIVTQMRIYNFRDPVVVTW
jgi:hypothetical protein